MDKARKQNKKMIGNLYRRVFDRDMSKCAYCGAPREGLDLENALVYLKRAGG